MVRIIDEEGCYWTEDETFGFWSKFKPLQKDQRDFWIVKALILLLSMRISGIKARFDYGT